MNEWMNERMNEWNNERNNEWNNEKCQSKRRNTKYRIYLTTEKEQTQEQHTWHMEIPKPSKKTKQ